MADGPSESADFQSERGIFRAEYERELGQWLRRRLGWLCIAYAVFQILATLAVVVTTVGAESTPGPSMPTAAEPRPPSESTEDLRPDTAGSAVRATPRVQTPLDAVSAIARDIARDVRARGEPNDRNSEGAAHDGNGDATQPAPSREERDTARVPVASDAGSDETAILIPWWAWILVNLPSLGVIVWFGLRVRPRLYTRTELVAAATRMILALGFLTFSLEAGLLLAMPTATAKPLLTIVYWHLTASLFLPWSWRESLRPIAPIFACWVLLRAGLAASGESEWLAFLASVLFAPLLFAPAMLLCYVRLRWHRNRFKSGFVGRRFVQMRREFLQARAVHESLFPKPEDFGWLRFDFGYRPAADIGGDFIHVWTDDRERFHLALIDVTGHGLASAMTVARIHGEIERLRDEYPDEGPGGLLLRLNRYFHRLLARHRLYATAVFITVDPYRGEMQYASAGHPPVFLRSRGVVRELESTTFLLGAVDDSMFGPEEVSVRLEEGDTMVLFTDGAFDARNPRGERFGLDRLREIIGRGAPPPRWTPYLMRLVETFEAGMPEDDLLVAEVTFFSRRSMSSITGDDLPQPALAGARS